jgi:hypothetical protein
VPFLRWAADSVLRFHLPLQLRRSPLGVSVAALAHHVSRRTRRPGPPFTEVGLARRTLDRHPTQLLSWAARFHPPRHRAVYSPSMRSSASRGSVFRPGTTSIRPASADGV